MINFSDSLPAAPAGGANVKWQLDVSGNLSAYTSTGKLTVAPVSNVLTIDASAARSFLINVNAAITSMVINNPTDGQEVTFLWAQDVTGHAVAVAANMVGGPTVTTTGGKHTTGKWTYNVGDTNWYFIGANNL